MTVLYLRIIDKQYLSIDDYKVIILTYHLNLKFCIIISPSSNALLQYLLIVFPIYNLEVLIVLRFLIFLLFSIDIQFH
jgi:hypothetical protein